jgi:hypothetical protein
LSKASTKRFTKVHVRRLLFLMGAGISVFTLILLGVQVLLSLAGKAPDPTFYNFYPIMMALGAVFGIERWWGQEQGDYNPFHDR